MSKIVAIVLVTVDRMCTNAAQTHELCEIETEKRVCAHTCDTQFETRSNKCAAIGS